MKIFAVLLMAIFALLWPSSSAAPKSSICSLEHSKNGDGRMSCDALFPSWTYNANTNECQQFFYGGCGGNDNRFSSKEECEKKCKE